MSSVMQLYIEELSEKVRKELPADINEMEWDVKAELLLFHALLDLKAVGTNRHFMMASIHNRFSTFLNREIPSKLIWDHLDTICDMAALHESNTLPFLNDEVEFELPPEEFDEIAMKRLGVVPSHSSKVKSKPPTRTSQGRQSKGKDFEFAKPFPVTTQVSVKLNRNAVADAKNLEKSSQSAKQTDSKKLRSDEEESTRRSTKGGKKDTPQSSTRSSTKESRQEPSESPSKRKRSSDSSDSKKADATVKRMRI